jgi:hypothetical protein
MNCRRCKEGISPFNSIGGICFRCYKKNLESAEKEIKIFEVCAYVYKYLLIFAGIISLIYIILSPISYVALLILISITLVFMVVSVLGMFPNIFPDISQAVVKERKLKFENQFQKYNPEAIAYCVYHPETEAIARCMSCFEPFCADDFIFIREKPVRCRKCGQPSVEFHFWAAINGILSVGAVSLIGIINIIITSEDFPLVFAFLLPFVVTAGVAIKLKRGMKQEMKELPDDQMHS